MLNNLITEVLLEWADSDNVNSQHYPQSQLSKMPGCPYNGRIQYATTLMSNESRVAFNKWKNFVLKAQEKFGRPTMWKPEIINYACKLGNAVEASTGSPSPQFSQQPQSSDAMGVGAPNNPSNVALVGPW